MAGCYSTPPSTMSFRATSNTPYNSSEGPSPNESHQARESHISPADQTGAKDKASKDAPVPSPVVSHMSSCRGDNEYMAQPILASKLFVDLEKHSVNLKADDFLHEFPPIVCNCDVKKFLKDQGRYFLKDDRLYVLGQGLNEAELAKYLNHIITLFASYEKKKVPRGYWTAEWSNKLLSVGPWSAKPDVMFLPVQGGYKIPNNEMMWPLVHAVAEMTSTPRQTRRIQDTAASKAFLMLYSQGDRTFVPTITFNRRDFSVKIFDHAGQMSFDGLKYSDELGTTIFLVFLLKMAFESWGFDVSMMRKLVKMPDNWEKEENKFPVPFQNDEQKYIKFLYCVPGGKTAGQDKTEAVSGPSMLPPPPPDYTSDESSVSKQSNPLKRKMVQEKPLQITLGSSKSELQANLICNIATIQCQTAKYVIKAEIFRSQSLIGRGTRVWIAVEEGEEGEIVIIKESWVLCQRIRTEASFIKGADPEQRQIPRILKSEEVSGACTQDLFFGPRELKHRVKRRLIMTPACVPLFEVESRLELFGVFFDYVLAIRYLMNNNRMHRDVSSANLMISSEPGSSDTWTADPILKDPIHFNLNYLAMALNLLEARSCRRGVLIDYDYGTFVDPKLADPFVKGSEPVSREPSGYLTPTMTNKRPHSGERTGTVPFMAIPLLKAPRLHRTAYDLESLFYVFIYALTHISFKQNHKKMKCSSAAVEGWFKDKSFHDHCQEKASQFHLFMEDMIIPQLQPDFQDLAPAIRELWLALYPQKVVVPRVAKNGEKLEDMEPLECCDKMLDIFVHLIHQENTNIIKKEKKESTKKESTEKEAKRAKTQGSHDQ